MTLIFLIILFKLKQKQSKYTEIKQDIIKQINTSDVIAEPGVLTSDNHLNFVTHSKTKLTNTLLKKILNQPKTQNITPNLKTPADKCKSKHLTDFIGNKTINKKAKMGIKKNLWAQSKLFTSFNTRIIFKIKFLCVYI